MRCVPCPSCGGIILARDTFVRLVPMHTLGPLSTRARKYQEMLDELRLACTCPIEPTVSNQRPFQSGFGPVFEPTDDDPWNWFMEEYRTPALAKLPEAQAHHTPPVVRPMQIQHWPSQYVATFPGRIARNT